MKWSNCSCLIYSWDKIEFRKLKSFLSRPQLDNENILKFYITTQVYSIYCLESIVCQSNPILSFDHLKDSLITGGSSIPLHIKFVELNKLKQITRESPQVLLRFFKCEKGIAELLLGIWIDVGLVLFCTESRATVCYFIYIQSPGSHINICL